MEHVDSETHLRNKGIGHHVAIFTGPRFAANCFFVNTGKFSVQGGHNFGCEEKNALVNPAAQ